MVAVRYSIGYCLFVHYLVEMSIPLYSRLSLAILNGAHSLVNVCMCVCMCVCLSTHP